MIQLKILLLSAMLILASALCGQEADSLTHYLQTAAQNNGAVKAAFYTYEAARQKVPQAGAYDDPQVDIGFFLDPMTLVDGREITRIQFMQMFPWFGVRKAARTEAQHMAQMAFEQFREARDNLFLEVSTQWHLLCLLHRKRTNSEENLQWLRQLETLALRRYASGGDVSGASPSAAPVGQASAASGAAPAMEGGMNMGGATLSASPEGGGGAESGMNMGGLEASAGLSDVLRIQLEMAESESTIESLRAEIAAAQSLFNALLHRPPESNVAVPDRIPRIAFALDPEQALAQITVRNPMLAMLREESLAYRAKAKMTEKMGYPMLGLGLQYMLIGSTPPPTSSDPMAMAPATTGMNAMNGKDMLMPMLSISLPLYRAKYKAARKEALFQQQAAEAQYEQTALGLEAELSRTIQLLNNAERKITLYGKQAALARTTCHLAVQEFTSGKNNLENVIRIQQQLLDYQLKESEATAEYNIIVLTIQKLTSQWNSI
jgi:outer membrane protein TolC